MIGTLQEDVVPVLRLEWVNGSAHYAGVTAVLITACKQPSERVRWLLPLLFLAFGSAVTGEVCPVQRRRCAGCL